MDFNEAKKTLGMVSHFFRALKKMDEVLDEGEKAVQAAIKARAEEAAAKGEADRIHSGLAGVKAQLGDLNRVYKEKTEDMEAKLKARHDEVMGKLQKEIDALKDKMAGLEDKLTKAQDEYEEKLKDYHVREQAAKGQVKFWESKLAESKKAYEDFKANL